MEVGTIPTSMVVYRIEKIVGNIPNVCNPFKLLVVVVEVIYVKLSKQKATYFL